MLFEVIVCLLGAMLLSQNLPRELRCDRPGDSVPPSPQYPTSAGPQLELQRRQTRAPRRLWTPADGFTMSGAREL